MKKPLRSFPLPGGRHFFRVQSFRHLLPQMGKRTRFILFLLVSSNLLTHAWLSWLNFRQPPTPSMARMYLLDEASQHIADIKTFEQEVKQVAKRLQIPPEWLMAVMYAESNFRASAVNFKGSGAVGLIQFMPATARELGITTALLRNMDPVHQLQYVHKYLAQVRRRYGSFTSLTDLYLAVLYPKAIGQDACYVLFGKPSKQYRQNAGLDENQDGYVSVSDIEKRMMRIFPTAYAIGL